LAAGAEIVCEKPLACSPVDLDRMIAAERRARGRITPVYQYRFAIEYRRRSASSMPTLPERPILSRLRLCFENVTFESALSACARRRPVANRAGAHDNAICARVRSRVERVFAARNAGSASSCA
jgi:hypothetical protein